METPHTTTNAYDHLIKILLVGDTGSNKSTLLRAYLDDSGVGQSGTTTLGLDYKLKDVRHKGKIIKLQLWDTAGQERFRSVTSSYYRGAHGALLCFTTERDPSFLSLTYWLDEIRNNAPINFQVLLVAVGSVTEDSDFNVEVARQFAREKQLQLMTCDLSDGVKVQQVFQTLVAKIMTSFESDNMAESVRLHDRTGSSPRDSGCLC